MTTTHPEPSTTADDVADTPTDQPAYPYLARGIDPRELRTDGNSRVVGDIRLNRPDLVASVAQHGLNPMISVVNVAPHPEGGCAVLVGFHRTAAAVAVKDRENPDLLIPVLVHAPGTTRDVLVAQGIENIHRVGYTQAEEAAYYEQLALEGFDDEEIATTLVRDVARVRAGRAVATTAAVRAVNEALPEVDLLTLANLTEFADDPHALDELATTLADEPHYLDWRIERLRDKRERADAQRAAEQPFTEQGYRLIEDDYNLPEGTAALEHLCGAQDTTPLDPADHGDCPGRAVFVSVGEDQAVHLEHHCVDFAEHGHRDISEVAVAAEQDRLRAEGVRIVDTDTDTTAVKLFLLQADAAAERAITADEHAACPGHAAHVGRHAYRRDIVVEYVCTDPDTHGHIRRISRFSPAATPQPDPAFSTGEINRAKANNKAWRAAKPDRRAWLKKYFIGWRKRKAADLPPRVHHWLALAPVLAADHLAEAKAHRYACGLLKFAEPTGYDRAANPLAAHLRKKSTTETQAILIRLAQVIGACEAYWDHAFTDKEADRSWRRPTPDARFYFELLDALGYPLSAVERLINDPTGDHEKWPHLAPASTEPVDEQATDVVQAQDTEVGDTGSDDEGGNIEEDVAA